MSFYDPFKPKSPAPSSRHPENMKPYYYVYRYQDRAPVVRHPTLEQAQAEAERLAAQHPGAHIEILKAIAISKVSGPASTFFVDGEGPEFERHREGLVNALRA